ncbi:MAG: type II toxin-antitoxin system RelE/ParE family toxin [Alphaproteobacteria bacterium]|jgi:toxin ParE1/3/4|nr:type II toxin-antitoxin system RelE/ParE family toxin [Alphaproteobacteria bacterium]
MSYINLTYADSFYFDLEEIENYLEEHYPRFLELTFLEIERVIDIIVENPFIGRNGKLENTREFLLKKLPYFIVYEINDDKLNILNIIHYSRNYP